MGAVDDVSALPAMHPVQCSAVGVRSTKSLPAGKNYRITVSNVSGYLCHLRISCQWENLQPIDLFAVFTHPENSKILRDMQRVGSRQVIRAEPGFKEMQVHAVTRVRDMWKRKRSYTNWLHVIEDSRDPECLRTTFHLIESEIFDKFTGEWCLRPLRDPASGVVVGCAAEANQYVLPKGVPIFLTRLPLVGQLIRHISQKAIKRLMLDLNSACDKVLAGHAKGKSTQEVLEELCGPDVEAVVAEPLGADGMEAELLQCKTTEEEPAEGGPLQPKASVDSFALLPSDDEEDEEEGGQQGEEGRAAAA